MEKIFKKLQNIFELLLHTFFMRQKDSATRSGQFVFTSFHLYGTHLLSHTKQCTLPYNSTSSDWTIASKTFRPQLLHEYEKCDVKET